MTVDVPAYDSRMVQSEPIYETPVDQEDLPELVGKTIGRAYFRGDEYSAPVVLEFTDGTRLEIDVPGGDD